jgi:hypothetical protein
MYNCTKCNAQCDFTPEPKIKLCANCARDLFQHIQGQYAMIPAKIVAQVMHAEGLHGVSLFYSDEVLKSKDLMNHHQVTQSQVMKGHCPGFTTSFKVFKLEHTYTPCTALSNFLGGANLVVAECEGFVQAVVLNAIREIFTDSVFDIVFHDLTLGHMPYVKNLFWKKDDPTEDIVSLGNWIYIARTTLAMGDFHDHAISTGEGGAASGWNLICTDDGAVKKYIGFGLSPTVGQVQELTLNEIMQILINAGPKRKSTKPIETDFFLQFRRRVKTETLDSMLHAVLPPF